MNKNENIFAQVWVKFESKAPLSYVTASNSRHNPVERIAILIFGSDLGARFDSKLQHSAVLGPNTALLWANSRPEI